MRNYQSALFGALLATGSMFAAPTAFAQVDPTLDPTAEGGATGMEVYPGDEGDTGYDTEPVPDDGEAAETGEAGEEGQAGFYYYDEPATAGQESSLMGEGDLAGGPTPELHVVRSGDTLWDICEAYFNDPWQWPRVWSYNPAITNPHWIYPGDIVRLREESQGPAGPLRPDAPPSDIENGVAAAAAPARGFTLRRLAFVEKEQLDTAFTIIGSEEERTMLSYNDVIYLDYPESAPPQVGRRYAVYSPTEPIVHPETKKTIGTFVRVLGEVEVLSVKKDKKARAIVRSVDDVLERGQRVGPLERTYDDMSTTPNERNLQGTIVAQLGGEVLIGARTVVFTDLGASDGVKPGNRLYIVRRGDAFPGEFAEQIGKNDQRFPAYAIGEIQIVDVGQSTSLGLVTLSVQESEIGDMVLMQANR